MKKVSVSSTCKTISTVKILLMSDTFGNWIYYRKASHDCAKISSDKDDKY